MYMKGSGFGTTIHDLYANQDVLGRPFRVFDKDVEITTVVKHTGIDKLELGVFPATPTIFLDYAE